jgi:hypothetical protein
MLRQVQRERGGVRAWVRRGAEGMGLEVVEVVEVEGRKTHKLTLSTASIRGFCWPGRVMFILSCPSPSMVLSIHA